MTKRVGRFLWNQFWRCPDGYTIGFLATLIYLGLWLGGNFN